MKSLPDSVLAFDLGHIIAETGKALTGVSPAAIAGRVYHGSFQSLTEGYEVDLAGREVDLDSEIILDGSAYDVLPTKGAVLQDADANFFKVFDVQREDPGPAYRLKVASRYAAQA